MKILVIHGPNLNLLGRRRPEVYGVQTLDEMNGEIEAHAKRRGVALTFYQSNSEGAIIDAIHEYCLAGTPRSHDALVINPGAYTHYSVAIRDAIEAVEIPAIEVHLTDIHARETFRQHSVIAAVCRNQICGRGPAGYLEAIDALVDTTGE